MLLAAIAGLYGLSVSSAFTVRRTEITGATWTSQDDILSALAVPSGQNLFTLSSADLGRRLSTIPALRGVKVSVALPDVLEVSITERQALVAWAVGDHRYLVDSTGLLFAELSPDPPAAAASLPVVVDTRSIAGTLSVGSTLDAVTLDAALRLGSLTPADLGSSASSLALTVDDNNGFVVSAVPAGWSAVFGFYTPTLRTTDLIPGQVRLLRSLLAGREASVGQVILADDRSGTYLPRGSASPAPSAKPAATPKPTATPRPTTAPAASPAPTATPKASASPKPSASGKP